jgi:hypothetical protein
MVSYWSSQNISVLSLCLSLYYHYTVWIHWWWQW